MRHCPDLKMPPAERTHEGRNLCAEAGNPGSSSRKTGEIERNDETLAFGAEIRRNSEKGRSPNEKGKSQQRRPDRIRIILNIPVRTPYLPVKSAVTPDMTANPGSEPCAIKGFETEICTICRMLRSGRRKVTPRRHTLRRPPPKRAPLPQPSEPPRRSPSEWFSPEFSPEWQLRTPHAPSPKSGLR